MRCWSHGTIHMSRSEVNCKCHSSSALLAPQFLVLFWVFQTHTLWSYSSPCRDAGITDAQDCVWLYTVSEDPNSDPHVCMISSLSTETSPQARDSKNNKKKTKNKKLKKDPLLHYIILNITCVWKLYQEILMCVVLTLCKSSTTKHFSIPKKNFSNEPMLPSR